MPIKYGAVEAVDSWIALPSTSDQILKILIHQPVGPDQLLHLFNGTARRNELTGCGHINAINVRVTHFGRCGGKVNLTGTSVTSHLHNFATGRAAHDRVVYQHDIFAAKLQLNGV